MKKKNSRILHFFQKKNEDIKIEMNRESGRKIYCYKLLNTHTVSLNSSLVRLRGCC